MAEKRRSLPEKWHSVYWFPSNKFVGEEPSEYEMVGLLNGKTLVLESLPNDEHSYMLIRLRLDNNVAIGNWYETTSPTGEFESAQYNGSGQLIVNPETYSMEGKWAGAGYDHKLKQMRVYTGNWEIKPVLET